VGIDEATSHGFSVANRKMEYSFVGGKAEAIPEDSDWTDSSSMRILWPFLGL
jgi:hypothetical protein